MMIKKKTETMTTEVQGLMKEVMVTFAEQMAATTEYGDTEAQLAGLLMKSVALLNNSLELIVEWAEETDEINERTEKILDRIEVLNKKIDMIETNTKKTATSK